MSAVIVPDLARLELGASQAVIYDRPVGLRLLYADPHTHTVAHTVVVLEGTLVADGQALGPGSYVHFPAGEVMHHEPAAGEDCLFVTVFHGPFDVQPV